MKASKVVFLVFLITLSLCAVNTRPVRAQSSGTIYIRSDGSVDPSTAPIQRDGNVYTFTSNINDSIVVERENIVVDGAGYKLQGTRSGCGINVTRISNAGNVTIKNVQITYFSWGIGLHSHSCTVSGNNITNNGYGVELHSSSNNRIDGNNITGNNIGLLIQESKNNIIHGNTITGNGWGIGISTTLNNIILGNNITRNESGIYSAGAANDIIYHNNLIKNTPNQVMDNALEPLSVTPLSVHVWDNGEEGNYWSDYAGVDADGDGVGDTPYHINSKSGKSNQDPYPLMKPVDISAVVIPEFPDTTPPTISIVSPENKTYTVTDISLTLAVNEPTSWRGYSLDGKANVTIAGKTNLTGLSDGMHSLTVYAKDIFGNIGSSGLVHFTIDTVLPNISILSPENKTYTTTDIQLTFTANEPVSWVGYSLDRQANVTIAGNTTLTGLSYDSHSLTVYANDTIGNTGTSETIYFTIAQKTEPQQEPFPTTWIVAAAAAIIVVIAVAALILKRRGK